MIPSKPRPLISAIIPVHNGERYLGEAIESVLKQGRDDCEVIVIDDGSTDGSASVARRYGSAVRYWYQPKNGVGAARNSGVARALGRFVTFLDADDLWLDHKLAVQLAAFDHDPTLDIVFGHVQQGHSPDMTSEVNARTRILVAIVPGNLPGTMMVKREAYCRVGPFSTVVKLGEGIDWYLRAVDLGLHILTLPDVLLWRRIHDSNTGLQHSSSRQDYVRIVKAALDRRRAGEASGAGREPTLRPIDPATSSQE